MKRLIFITTVFTLAATASPCTYLYEGKWGTQGSGNGQFLRPEGIAVAPNGNVYVADENLRVQYFTPTGSFLGKWDVHAAGVAVAPTGNVYVVQAHMDRVQYFTPSGSFLGKWGSSGSGNGQFNSPSDLAIADNRSVYVLDTYNHRVQYFTPTGSFLGKWGSKGTGNGQFWSSPLGIDIRPGNEVFVTDHGNYRVQVFTLTGSFLRKFRLSSWVPIAIDVGKYVFVSDPMDDLVYYFNRAGGYLGSFGGRGAGNGQFDQPMGLAYSNSGRIYVAEYNHRVQYFRPQNPSVSPGSLGRVKALFE